MGGIKITPADRWFSKCIREAYDWTCITCGKQYPQGHGGLECSHGYSRGNWSIRFKQMNARPQCTACHFRVGPAWMHTELTEFEREVLAEWRIDALMGKEYRKTKGKGELSIWFKKQHDNLLELRAHGFTGRLGFEDWY